MKHFIDLFKKYVVYQLYTPTQYIGLLFNPFYFARRGLYLSIQSFSSSIERKILDVGCGRKPYEKLFNRLEYFGIDMEKSGHNHSASKVDQYYDGKIFPLADNSFDSVFCSQTLEHVSDVNFFLSEIQRVLKADGNLLLTVPFLWDEHEQPFDFQRYTSYGIKNLLENHGFKTIKYCKSAVGTEALTQLISLSVYKTIPRNHIIFRIISNGLIAFINIFGFIFSKIFKGNADLYLDNIILVKTTKK